MFVLRGTPLLLLLLMLWVEGNSQGTHWGTKLGVVSLDSGLGWRELVLNSGLDWGVLVLSFRLG